MVAAATPKPKPAATRPSVTNVSRCRSPVLARSTKVANTTDGGGTRRPVDQPMRTTNSQATAAVTGKISPSTGRANRAQDGAPADAGAAELWPDVRSATAVSATRERGPQGNAMRPKAPLPAARGEVARAKRGG